MFLGALSLLWCAFTLAYRLALQLFAWSHAVLPWGADLALLLALSARLTRLRRPDGAAVDAALAPLEPPSRCVAHRGAALDAPENTLQAFKYCVDRGCSFVEFDVRMTSDGACVLLHDDTLSRVAQVNVHVATAAWERIRDVDLSVNHPLKDRYSDARPVLLDDALDYLIGHGVHMFIDLKGGDGRVVDKVVAAFRARPHLYSTAVVTSFNPLYVYQVRRADARIIGALAYRPFCFSAVQFSAEDGPGRPNYPNSRVLHWCARALDVLHACLWESSVLARWCGVSAVLLHKDCISQKSVHDWRRSGFRVLAWTVNHPAEKHYLQKASRVPYFSDTLVGELRDAEEPLKIYSLSYNGSATAVTSAEPIGTTLAGDTFVRKPSEHANGNVEPARPIPYD